jgi:hypothetical protein
VIFAAAPDAEKDTSVITTQVQYSRETNLFVVKAASPVTLRQAAVQGDKNSTYQIAGVKYARLQMGAAPWEFGFLVNVDVSKLIQHRPCTI